MSANILGKKVGPSRVRLFRGLSLKDICSSCQSSVIEVEDRTDNDPMRKAEIRRKLIDEQFELSKTSCGG